MVTQNQLSYNQHESEELLAKALLVSGEQIRYAVNFVNGDNINEKFSDRLINLENIKEQFFKNYHGLWKELANR